VGRDFMRIGHAPMLALLVDQVFREVSLCPTENREVTMNNLHRIEVWNLFKDFNRTRYLGAFAIGEFHKAFDAALRAKRRQWRVRHFYDRHERRHITQILTGNGYGIR
jgi:hypothetical protein